LRWNVTAFVHLTELVHRVITMSTFADSRYGRFDAQDDVFDVSSRTEAKHFGGHRRSALKQVAGTGLTA